MQSFIDVFYGDNASRVLRVDMTMYTILAYLAVFRLEELGMAKFKDLCSSVEPSKVSNFVAYVFNKVNRLLTVIRLLPILTEGTRPMLRRAT